MFTTKINYRFSGHKHTKTVYLLQLLTQKPNSNNIKAMKVHQAGKVRLLFHVLVHPLRNAKSCLKAIFFFFCKDVIN